MTRTMAPHAPAVSEGCPLAFEAPRPVNSIDARDGEKHRARSFVSKPGIAPTITVLARHIRPPRKGATCTLIGRPPGTSARNVFCNKISPFDEVSQQRIFPPCVHIFLNGNGQIPFGADENPTASCRTPFLSRCRNAASRGLQCRPTTDSSLTFVPGDSNDAVIRAALIAPTTKTVQVTISNTSSFALGEGVISTLPPTGFDATALNAFTAYMRNTATTRAAVRQAALTVNVSAFIVPPVAANGTQTILISVPAGTQLIYAARVGASTTDFVATEGGITWPNGTTGTFQTGFTLAANGTVTRGNSSTGTSPSIAAIAYDVTASCSSSGNMARQALLISDDFAAVPNTSAWPMNSGYDLEFNGDWYTDGATARVWNPTGGDPAAPKPATTGFVKFLEVCPTSGATITITANINAAFTSSNSDATLVLYYFDSASALIRVDANHKIGKGNVRKTTLFESAVPLNARRIAIAPMALMAADETSAIFFSKLDATYAPKDTFKVTSVADDSLGTPGGPTKQPGGWTEFGGDYFAMASDKWVTLWNSKWGGDQSKLPPIDTGIVKRFTMPSFQAGDVLDARLFAAATFTDPSSFVRLRVLFNNSSGTLISALDSDRLAQRSYASLDLLAQPIPAGTASVDVILNGYLGPTETSSFYAQDLTVNAKRLLVK